MWDTFLNRSTCTKDSRKQEFRGFKKNDLISVDSLKIVSLRTTISACSPQKQTGLPPAKNNTRSYAENSKNSPKPKPQLTSSVLKLPTKSKQSTNEDGKKYHLVIREIKSPNSHIQTAQQQQKMTPRQRICRDSIESNKRTSLPFLSPRFNSPPERKTRITPPTSKRPKTPIKKQTIRIPQSNNMNIKKTAKSTSLIFKKSNVGEGDANTDNTIAPSLKKCSNFILKNKMNVCQRTLSSAPHLYSEVLKTKPNNEQVQIKESKLTIGSIKSVPTGFKPLEDETVKELILTKPFKGSRFGERGSGYKTRGGPQDFLEIRDHCLDSGTLFEDPEFPADDSSLFFSKRPDRHYEWKRPHEIADNPQLFVEGYSRFDVQQGELGDCWLLAAVANLTLYKRLFFQIVPDDQGFDDKYAGVFHFRFWQYGKWVDVVIDDRLPTYRGQLVYLHSTEDNEFWSALLEKAYAKLHGSYEALKGGSTCEAMEDFTGGVTEMYEMNASPPNLFKIILKAFERSSLMGCSIEPDPHVLEAETPEGLIRGHAYSITRVQYVDISTPNVTGKIPLLRLRNPWGNEAEWNGPWSDGSAEWRYISESEKQAIGLTFDNDGEFWMSFKDFQNYFSRLEICNLNPDSLTEDEMREGNKKQWEMSVFEGEWVRGVSAGGCRNFLDTFWHNPQYRITLTEEDDDDEENCTLIVALMQKNRRSIRNTGAEELTIGFAIYHLPYPDRVPKPLDINFFKYNASVARSPSFINLREVSCRFKLPKGTYCIVPSTFDPNEEGEFLLRVFSENKNNMEENDNEVVYNDNIVPPVPIESEAPERQHETDEIYQHFLKLAGEDQEVNWTELKEVLDHSLKQDLQAKGFSKDICRSMVAMLDDDRSGKLNYEEFKTLWVLLRKWKDVWYSHDSDRSGSFSGFELRDALRAAGYQVNNKILNALMHRYGSKNGEIQFDDFIMCAIKLRTMFEVFKAKEKNNSTEACFTLEEWLETTLYT